jgi:hypothetical protein
MSPLSAAAEARLAPKVPWRKAFDPAYLKDPSTLVLLAANAVPLFGVLFGDWDLFLLMMLYWMETGIIGFWAILRMALLTRLFALFLGPVFIVHFGGFMTGHLVFLKALFAKGRMEGVHGPVDFLSVVVVPTGLWIPLLALFVSHGVSFARNALKAPVVPTGTVQIPATLKDGTPTPAWVKDLAVSLAAKGGGVQEMMMAPYARIVVMHLTIIFGGMLTMVLQAPKAAFLLLVALKTAVDLGAHVRKNFKPPAPPAVPTGPGA